MNGLRIGFLTMTLFAYGGGTAYAFRAEDGQTEDTRRAPGKEAVALAPTADQRTASAAADKAGTEVKWNGPAPLSIRGKGLGQRQAFSGGKGLAVQAAAKVEQKAVAVLDNLSRFYGFKDVEQEL